MKEKKNSLIVLSPGWAHHPTANVQKEIEIDCTIPAYSKQGHLSDLIRQGDASLFRGKTIGWNWHHGFGVEEFKEFAYLSNLSLWNGIDNKNTARIRIEGRHIVKFVFTADGVEFWLDGELLESITEYAPKEFPPGIYFGVGGRGDTKTRGASIIFHSVKVDSFEILHDPELELHDGAYFGTVPVPETRKEMTHKVFPWKEEGYGEEPVINGLVNLNWDTIQDGDIVDIRGIQTPPPFEFNNRFPALIITIQKRVKIIASKDLAMICGCREVTKATGGFDQEAWVLENGKWRIAAPGAGLSRWSNGFYQRTDKIVLLREQEGTAEIGTWEIIDNVLIVNTGDLENHPDLLFANTGYQFDISYQQGLTIDGLHFIGSDILNTTAVHTSQPMATDIVFSHCWFQFKGVRLFRDWDDWTFRECDFSESSYGVYTFNTSGEPSANGLTIEGCRGWEIKGGDGHFIGIQNSNDVTLRGNTCWGCGDPNGSITVWGGNDKDLKHMLIRDNVVIDEQSPWAGAINLSGQNPGQPNRKSALIINNAVYNPKHQGIRINWSDPVLIKGNLIESPGDHGISGQNSSGQLQAIIVDNRILNVPVGKKEISLSNPGPIVKE